MEEGFLEFIWLPSFERSAKKLLSGEDRRAIEEVLCAEITAGDRMPRTAGFRKLRYGPKGRGKRGGVRVVYLPLMKRARVFMALAYDKGEKATLTRQEEDDLAAVARVLAREDE
jgi:mRNA-degrading endonuclease RelE of RelBE toxin-antitoxin system